jgi:Hypervirulence associated proteins TUDOR domain
MSDSKSNEFKKCEKVEWDSSQGTIEGSVKKKLTQPTDIKGHHVAASKDNPEYLVESDRTGKEAAHKPASLHHKS